ncbi:hypothetical protein [Nocardioides hankookensis]|uniref:Uncharacterized protein n=1 Tax=Nocardioides hankookensis TaxID=443157 RepID=A0ABW1LLI2_9ACTN
MSESTREADTCRRCGHTRRHVTGSVARVARRAVGRKPPRVECGEQTDLGWACPCRSRFHAS